MSKMWGLGDHEVGVGGGGGGGGGGGYYIHSEYIWHRLLVFNTFFMTISNFWGVSPLYQKVGELKPPPAPQVLCFWYLCVLFFYHRELYFDRRCNDV